MSSVKYQNPNFDKKMYWYRRTHGIVYDKQGRQVGGPWRGQLDMPTLFKEHSRPDWPKKPVTKKAFLKNSKRARKEDLAYASK